MDRFVTVHRSSQYKPTSKRLLGKQKEKDDFSRMKEEVLGGLNEPKLKVCCIVGKGRGVRALRTFEKDEFVLEYKGEMIGLREALLREALYSKDESIGSYMFFFKHNAKSYCVDATEETEWKGRLVNHSYLNPNARIRVVDFGSSFHLVLVATRHIDIGEEILYDYGETRPQVLAKNPWFRNS